MIGYPIVRLAKLQRDQSDAREAAWLAAIEAGETTQAALAKSVGLSAGQISRRLARARQSRPESGSSTSSEIPRLELCDYPNPLECCHSRTSTSSDGRIKSCMRCDALSTDGGVTWLDAQSSKTPDIAVLAPNGTGRGERLQRLTAGVERDPGGPTSYAPDPELAGGKGSPSGRCSSRGS
jgi:hypothetical protein